MFEYFGGWAAVSEETLALYYVEDAVRKQNAKDPDKVEFRDPPVGVREKKRRQEYAETRAEAWRRKQQERAKQLNS